MIGGGGARGRIAFRQRKRKFPDCSPGPRSGRAATCPSCDAEVVPGLRWRTACRSERLSLMSDNRTRDTRTGPRIGAETGYGRTADILLVPISLQRAASPDAIDWGTYTKLPKSRLTTVGTASVPRERRGCRWRTVERSGRGRSTRQQIHSSDQQYRQRGCGRYPPDYLAYWSNCRQ